MLGRISVSVSRIVNMGNYLGYFIQIVRSSKGCLESLLYLQEIGLESENNLDCGDIDG